MKKRKSFFNNSMSVKKILVSTGLSLAAGIMISGGTVVQAVETGSVSVKTGETTSTSVTNNGLKQQIYGTCPVTLNNGVLTVGDGTLSQTTGANVGLASIVNDPDSVTKIILGDNIKTDQWAAGLFRNFKNLTEIDNLNKIDSSNLNNELVSPIYGMFAHDEKLKNVDISNWKLPEGTVPTLAFLDTKELTNVSLPAGMSLAWSGINYISIFGTDGGGVGNVSLNKTYVLTDEKGNKKIISGDNLDGSIQDDNYFETDYVPSSPIIAKSVDKDTVVGDVTFKTDQGDMTVKNFEGQMNDKGQVEVPAPKVDGYDPSPATVLMQATKKDNGDDTYSYTFAPVDSDAKNSEITYSKTPTKPVNPSKPNHGNSGSSHVTQPTEPEKPTEPTKTIEDTDLDIETLPNSEFISLYKVDTNKANRALSPRTDWRVDKIMTLDGTKYYRVSTNEWVKASDAYVYESQNLIIETGNGFQYLTNANGDRVGNRALAAHSDWRTDRLAHINGKTYYRVATNEFVPTDQVTIK